MAEKRGVSVSKRVSSTSDIRLSVVSGWSTSRSTPARKAGVEGQKSVTQRRTEHTVTLEVECWSVVPVIPGLEGFEEGLAPSSSSSAPLERGPSINMSPSSISSHTPPI